MNFFILKLKNLKFKNIILSLIIIQVYLNDINYKFDSDCNNKYKITSTGEIFSDNKSVSIKL